MKNIFLDQHDYISQLVKVSNIDNSTLIPAKMIDQPWESYFGYQPKPDQV